MGWNTVILDTPKPVLSPVPPNWAPLSTRCSGNPGLSGCRAETRGAVTPKFSEIDQLKSVMGRGAHSGGTTTAQTSSSSRCSSARGVRAASAGRRLGSPFLPTADLRKATSKPGSSSSGKTSDISTTMNPDEGRTNSPATAESARLPQAAPTVLSSALTAIIAAAPSIKKITRKQLKRPILKQLCSPPPRDV
ncbi:MAG: hypothetical protein BWY99_02370 [Synergistetes bacterium ADurb.BinA166]|nr:MAG: hypothetical protein BWY99_02370 [Synergistetes bacterium ADurb.BinA166]